MYEYHEIITIRVLCRRVSYRGAVRLNSSVLRQKIYFRYIYIYWLNNSFSLYIRLFRPKYNYIIDNKQK